MTQRFEAVLLALIVATLAFASTVVCAADKKPTKYARFEAAGKTAYGIVEGEKVRELKGDLFGEFEVTGTGVGTQSRQQRFSHQSSSGPTPTGAEGGSRINTDLCSSLSATPQRRTAERDDQKQAALGHSFL